MINILELLDKYSKEKPGASILYDEAHSKGITYAQLDDMSARVCGWLKAIGKQLMPLYYIRERTAGRG